MDEQQRHELILNLLSFYAVFQKEMLALVHNNNSELSPLLYKMLKEISLDGSILPSELSKRLSITVPNTSRSIRKLAELGYITKTRDAEDKRIAHLSLTGKGMDVLAMSEKMTDAVLSKRFEALSAEEIKRLSDAFSVSRELLEKMGARDVMREESRA